MKHTNSLSIATASIDITPSIGSHFVGHINRDKPATGVLDPLYGRVLYMRDSESQEEVLLVNCDLLEFGKEESDSIVHALSQTTGISASRIILTATHTHTGPPTLPFAGKPSDRNYLKILTEKLCSAVEGIQENASPCEVSVQRTYLKIACNRRKKIDGKIVMAPNPEGPIDPDLTTVFFRTDKGIEACILHFAMHPTTLSVFSYLISADYPGRALKHVRSFLESVNPRGAPAPTCLFLQGACGDVKPAVFDTDGNFKEGTEEDIEYLGNTIARAMEKVYFDTPLPVFAPRLRLKATPFSFKYHPLPTLETIQNEIEKLERNTNAVPDKKEKKAHIDPQKQNSVFMDWAKTIRTALLDPSQKLPDQEQRELVCLYLGKDIVFVFVPGELFCSTGLEIKELSPFPFTCVTCYFNGSVGYIPTLSSIEEGGYEATDAYKYYGAPAPFYPNTEEALKKRILGLLRGKS